MDADKKLTFTTFNRDTFVIHLLGFEFLCVCFGEHQLYQNTIWNLTSTIANWWITHYNTDVYVGLAVELEINHFFQTKDLATTLPTDKIGQRRGRVNRSLVG